MKNLTKTRELINEIDQDLTRLYEKRMSLVKDVAEFKKANNMEILDPDRECEVIEKNLDYLTDKELADYYKEFLQLLMDQSKEIQEKLIKES